MDLWPENFLSVIKVKNKLLLSILTRHSHWYYKKATNLVGMSQTMTSHLRAITDKDMRHTVTIPQTSEKLYERTIIDKVLVKKFGSTFNVLFTGNISPAQSFDTMIAAAKLLKEKGFSDVRWIIVGDGMSKQSVEAKVTAEGLDKVFVFEGSHPTERMPAYTNIADVLVGCLVKSELLEATIPAKVMSYIASGKPMVLAMDGEVQDLINNTIRCGYAGPTEDAKILASNIEKIHRLSKKDRGAMGRRARDYHFKHLERSVILGQLERFMFTN
jgi:glycosyltransferase involved in cell wall biosynthesis